jgi:hypothetical protein
MIDPSDRPPRKRKRSKPPTEQGAKASAKHEPRAAVDAQQPHAPQEAAGSRWTSTTPWVLVAGLAGGYIIGREVTLYQGSDAGDRAPTASVTQDVSGAAKAYASVAEFPAGWITDTSMPALAGLDEAQKVTVLQAFNERNCECGCPFGSVANCLAKDPNCPRSPQLAKHAVDLAKRGSSLAEILAGIDAKQAALGGKPAGAAAPPAGPAYVELAAHSPRKGPKHAKVTVVEFSEFQ